MKRLLLAALLCAVPLEAQQIGAAYRLDTLAVRLDGGAGGVNYSTMPAPTGCASGYVPYFDASLKLVCSPTVYAPATNTTTLGTLAAKNVVVTALPASGSITVTPTGTTGATTYTYSLQACLADGTCNAAGAASTTAAGNATLSASNFNRLSWSAVAGAASYKVRRDVGGATQGVIWSGTALTVDDTGLAGDSSAKPTVDGTGTIQANNFRSDVSNNIVAGVQALGSVTTGGSNVAYGAQALFRLTSGSSNTAIGSLSGYFSGASPSTSNGVTTASNLTFVGVRSGLGSATQRSNSTAIGANAYVDANNRVVLGDGAVVDVWAGSTGQARLVGTGIRLVTGTRPTCDATTRGLLFYVAGGAGVADTCEVCRKDNADAYAWVSLF